MRSSWRSFSILREMAAFVLQQTAYFITSFAHYPGSTGPNCTSKNSYLTTKLLPSFFALGCLPLWFSFKTLWPDLGKNSLAIPYSIRTMLIDTYLTIKQAAFEFLCFRLCSVVALVSISDGNAFQLRSQNTTYFISMLKIHIKRLYYFQIIYLETFSILAQQFSHQVLPTKLSYISIQIQPKSNITYLMIPT